MTSRHCLRRHMLEEFRSHPWPFFSVASMTFESTIFINESLSRWIYLFTYSFGFRQTKNPFGFFPTHISQPWIKKIYFLMLPIELSFHTIQMALLKSLAITFFFSSFSHIYKIFKLIWSGFDFGCEFEFKLNCTSFIFSHSSCLR